MEQGQGEATASTDSKQRAGIRGRLLVLGLVSLMAVVAALGFALTRGNTDGDTEQDAIADLPTPHSITRGGVSYEVGLTSPAGASTNANDPQSVTVYALDIEHPEDPNCSWIDPQARVAAETPDEVRIATFHYSVRRDADDGVQMCGYGTDGSTSGYSAMELHLDSPLGERRLIDEMSGEVIGVLDPHYVPSPAYVPAGYRQAALMHFTPEHGFVALRQFHDRRNGSSLEIRVRSSTAWSRSGKVLSRDRISDADATVTEEDYQRCVSWSPRVGLVAEVCSLTVFLAPLELLRIAKSIAPLD